MAPASEPTWDDRKVRVGAAIRARRQELGLSQVALAERLDQAQSVISHWEAGHVLPSPPNQRALARALDISHAELFAALFQDEVPV